MKKNNLIEVNEISKETKVSLKTRVISAVIGIALIVPAIVIGDWYFLAVALAAALIGNYEIVKCAKKKYCIWLYIVTMFIGFIITCWPLLDNWLFGELNGETIETFRLYKGFDSLNLPIILIVAGALLLFFIVVLHPSLTVKDACFIFTFVILVSLGLQSALILRYYPSHIATANQDSYFNFFDNFESCSLIIYALLATFLTDAGAYFFGIFFGKNKLNERISPKKTWEGFFGGYFTSFILSAAFAFILAACGHPILNGIFDLQHWYSIVIVSSVAPLLATLGDLIFSSIKRFFEIKDFGNCIPGHGGILDRLDSLVFVFIFVAIYVVVFHEGALI